MNQPTAPERTTDDVWQVLFGMNASEPKSWADWGTRLIRAGVHIVELSEAAAPVVRAWWDELAAAPPGTGRQMSTEDEGVYADATSWPIGWLLIGYGLENLAKAILVTRDTAQVKGSSALPASLDKHSLVDLMKAALGELNAADVAFLKAVTEHVLWLGRYPIPKSWKQLKDEQTWRQELAAQREGLARLQDLMQRIRIRLIPST